MQSVPCTKTKTGKNMQMLILSCLLSGPTGSFVGHSSYASRVTKRRGRDPLQRLGSTNKVMDLHANDAHRIRAEKKGVKRRGKSKEERIQCQGPESGGTFEGISQKRSNLVLLGCPKITSKLGWISETMDFLVLCCFFLFLVSSRHPSSNRKPVISQNRAS